MLKIVEVTFTENAKWNYRSLQRSCYLSILLAVVFTVFRVVFLMLDGPSLIVFMLRSSSYMLFYDHSLRFVPLRSSTLRHHGNPTDHS